VAEPAPFDPAGGAEAGMPRRERGARAGRNLPLAILTALLLAGVLIASLVLSRPAFIAFLLGIVTLALLELLTVLRARATRPARPVVLAMGGLLVTILAAFAWYLVDRGRTEVTRNVAATVFAVVYVPFMAAHLSLVVGRADHYVGAVLGYAALVVIYDTAAYATGATLGRRPIAPQVSPNKSWEGAIGASVVCLLAGAFLLPLWEPWTLASGLVLAAATCVVAPLGDLSESMLKRDLAVKDMGSILPGHGGMLDRIDALLFMAPVLYYVLAAFDLIRSP
jgi:phosphatidate cytidylyltransferase